MTVDLISQGEKAHRIYLTWDMWPRILRLAYQYGWKPRGTHAGALGLSYCKTEAEAIKEEEKWDGGYLSNDSQVVDREDAAAIANALEKALDDIPDHPAAIHKEQTVAEWLTGLGTPPEGIAELSPDILSCRVARQGETLNDFEYFSYDAKPLVVDFISFCREGAFEIW